MKNETLCELYTEALKTMTELEAKNYAATVIANRYEARGIGSGYQNNKNKILFKLSAIIAKGES